MITGNVRRATMPVAPSASSQRIGRRSGTAATSAIETANDERRGLQRDHRQLLNGIQRIGLVHVADDRQQRESRTSPAPNAVRRVFPRWTGRAATASATPTSVQQIDPGGPIRPVETQRRTPGATEHERRVDDLEVDSGQPLQQRGSADQRHHNGEHGRHARAAVHERDQSETRADRRERRVRLDRDAIAVPVGQRPECPPPIQSARRLRQRAHRGSRT